MNKGDGAKKLKGANRAKSKGTKKEAMRRVKGQRSEGAKEGKGGQRCEGG